MASKAGSGNPRDVILARRALYLSTALTALGCTNKNPTPNASSGGVTVTSNASASAVPSAEPPEVAPAAPFAEVLSQRPPMVVPDGLSAKEQGQLRGLNAELEAHYATVRKVWQQMPDCDPSARRCEPKWQALSKDAQAMYRALRGRGFAPCGGNVGQTGSYSQRKQIHRKYLASLTARIETHLGAVAKSHGRAGEDRWKELLTGAKEPQPVPCLSPCRAPLISDITGYIFFDHGIAELRLQDVGRLHSLNNVRTTHGFHGTRAVLVIRGHADPSEPDGDALALKRAKAVQEWLVKAGLAKAQVRIESLGSRLQVAHSDSDAAANQRVDFEVVAVTP